MAWKSSQPRGDKPPKARQTTLFQTWGYEGNVSLNTSVSSNSGAKETISMDDEDDDALSKALDEELAIPGTSTDIQNSNALSATPLETLPGFDVSAGTTWIYPTNMSVRKYQVDIVQSCLYENTLVCLPTGLGKTFIAAVVIYNFYRWYPQSKIIFMAPTKPLVAQQIEACYNIMGIPQIDTCEMTGNVNINSREKSWNSKRVFFLTPQVMSNDLARRSFPAEQVKVVIVDEAHRAQGDYAYCQVVRELVRTGQMFRVVALSATPGTDLNAVKLVIQNLMISHIEIRHEDSPDIREYSHQRTIEKHVIPLDEDLKKVQSIFRDHILDPAIKRLGKNGVLGYRGNTTNPDHYSRWALLQARNEFRQNPPSALDRTKKGMLERDFSNAISLYHAYELLTKHGLRSFFNFLQRSTGDESGLSNNSRNESPSSNAPGISPNIYINRILRYEMNQIPAFSEMMNDLKHKFRKDSENSSLNSSRPKINSQLTQIQGKSSSPKDDFIVGHPKLAKLRDLIIEHFQAKENHNIQTRAIIFSEARDSVTEINACLRNYRPLIRPMEFVGQAGKAGKRGNISFLMIILHTNYDKNKTIQIWDDKIHFVYPHALYLGLTQKEQVEVIRRFKEGNFNTMVATCVGEEGLDIGEVDLIIFFDVSKSPIRLIQRMGRTGRKREGRVIVLLTEGKQEAIYNSAIYSKNSIKKALLDKNRLIPYLFRAPRMVPKGINPVCHKMELKPQATFVGKKAAKRLKSSDKQTKIKNHITNEPDSTTLIQKETSYAVTSGFMTSSELDEWTKKYKLNNDESKTVPKLKSKVETWTMSRSEILEKIKREQEKSITSTTNSNEIDLSEWILWQDSYQKRHLVSQSKTSEAFESALDCIRGGNKAMEPNKFIDYDEQLHPYSDRRNDYNEINENSIHIEEENIADSENNFNIKAIRKPESKNISDVEELDDEYKIHTPEHVLDVVETEKSLGNEDDEEFWDSWFPIEENITKLKIKPPPDTKIMLESIPDQKVISAFDINAAWKRIDAEFKNNSKKANLTNDASINDEAIHNSIIDSHGTNKYPELNMANRALMKNNLEPDSLLTSTPSANKPRKSAMSNISPIIHENSRSNTSRKLTKFKAIPEEEEEYNANPESIDKSGQQNSVYSATQLVSFVNRTSLPCPEETSEKLSVDNETIMRKTSSGMTSNLVNLTAEERRIVQKLSFNDTGKISDSLREAFNVSYDDVKIRGCSTINKSKKTNAMRNQEPDEIQTVTSKNSSHESNRASICDSHHTIEEVIKCSSAVDVNFLSGHEHYVSNFDIEIDDNISMFSQSDVSIDRFFEKDTDFKLPDLEAYETKSKTPSRLKKKNKSPIKTSPNHSSLHLPSTSNGSATNNRIESELIDIPSHFDREVFSQLPPDIQKELLTNQGVDVPTNQSKSPDDDTIQSQIIGCKPKGVNKRLVLSSSEEELASETDSPLVIRGPRVVNKNHDNDTSTNDLSISKEKSPDTAPSRKSNHCRARKFIDMEAVLSESGENFADSASEDTGIDGYEASFVDIATQYADDAPDDIDEQAIYLRSVKSPITKPIIYQPPKKQMRREDIFSQFDDVEDEYDLQDSFVVDGSGSEGIEYESKTDPLDFVDEFEDGNCKKLKAKDGKSKLKGKKRGRILTKACSSSSDEEQKGKFIDKPKRLIKTPNNRDQLPDSQTIETSKKYEENVAPEADALKEKQPTIELSESDKTNSMVTNSINLRPEISQPACSIIETDKSRHSILISANELQKAQEIVSILRHDHGINVVASRSGIEVGASYMMSSRCALIRVITQDFCNATNRSDLILKCQKMNDLYERPWIVIETERKHRDCMNPDDVVVTSNHQLFGKEQRTKYIDGVLAQLSQSKIKVLFSESNKETSGFIVSVLKKESNKGFGLPKNLELNKRTESLLPFYMSIPGVGLGTALHLIENYKNPKDFIQSAQATMLRKSNLTDVDKIKKVQHFLRKDFGHASPTV